MHFREIPSSLAVPSLARAGRRWAGRRSRRHGRIAARLGSPAVVRAGSTPASGRGRGAARRLWLGLAAMALLNAGRRPASIRRGRAARSQAHGTNVMIALDLLEVSMLGRGRLAQRLEKPRAAALEWPLALGWAGQSRRRHGLRRRRHPELPDDAGRRHGRHDPEGGSTPGHGRRAGDRDLGRAIEVATGAFERGSGQGGARCWSWSPTATTWATAKNWADAVAQAARKGIVIDAIGLARHRAAAPR